MISIPNHIRLLITNQYQFLSSMLDKFPYLLNKWIEEQEKDAQVLANIESSGDCEVYHSIYQSEISKLESCSDEKQLFNQAMFIMTYSYYESIMLRIAKEESIALCRPSCIANKFGVELDVEYSKISKYIHETILPLRNQLCHNNNGTLFARDNEKDNERKNILKLVENKRIEIEDGRIYINNTHFIQETLDIEYRLLIKLADICGYKTKYLGVSNDK